MGHFVITISRGYGSGGRSIGILLSKMLGVEYYARDILRMASDESGIKEELFYKSDEKAKSGLLHRSAKAPTYSETVLGPDSPNFVSDANLYNYQAQVIRGLAEKESCVIIGRAADYVLRDNPDAVHVSIQASFEDSVKTVMQQTGLSEKEAQKEVRRVNKERADFYTGYTGRRWDDELNYDLTLNTSKMSPELCAITIIDYVKRKLHLDLEVKEV